MYRSSEKYSYISHPDNLPLELNGSSKKRVNSLKKQDFLQTKCNMNEQSRSLILKKIQNSKYDFQNTKSILPQPQTRKVSRPNSIKTFSENKQNTHSSGIDYLMQKTQNLKSTCHKQRAHLRERFVERNKITTKKHFGGEGSKGAVKEEENRPIRHKESENVKLTQDIYSNPYRLDKELVVRKKVQSNNYFRRGEELGYEEKKAKKFSDMKMIEMVGSQHVKQERLGLREKRQDWRVSNVTFF